MRRAWYTSLPTLAALVTLVFAWLSAQAADPGVAGLWRATVALLSLPAPIVVALAWGWATLLAGRWARLLVPMAIWPVLGFGVLPALAVWPLLTYAAAGVIAGIALAQGWRLDRSMMAVALGLLPFIVWTVLQMPLREQLGFTQQRVDELLEQNLPAGADTDQRALTLDSEREKLETVFDLAVRFAPALIGIGLLGQAGIVLGLLRWSTRALGLVLPSWNLPPFDRWRLPFYLVWLLVLGLGLLLTRLPHVANAGLNLACAAAAVLSLQGLAVQYFVSGRLMPRAGRVAYWTIMGVFFGHLMIASSVVLGLADQWLDMRRLQAPDREDEGPPNE